MSEVKICPVCGREVHLASPRAVYCSEACRRTAANARLLRRIANDPEAHEAHNEACRRNRLRKAEGEGPNKPLDKMRQCHDCGKPTWDYRCAECRAIWRAKHGAGGLYDPAAGFRGGEVEHEVAI